MRGLRFARVPLSGVVALVVCTAALAAAQIPVFRARTVVTELEVHVTDAAGRDVPDLSLEDFEVREDDVPQELLGVERLVARRSTSPAAVAGNGAPAASAAAEVIRGTNTADAAARVWALVVDDLRVPGAMRDEMKTCLQALVDGMAADDLIALVPTSGNSRASREFTRDRAAIRQAIEALRFPREFDGVRSVTPMGSIEPSTGPVGPATTTGPDRLDLVSADNRLISTLGNASRMLGRAGTVRATVVLLSQGMPVGLSDDYRRSVGAQGSWTLLRRYDEWRQVLDRVQRSGVTMHVIDPTGFDPRMARRVSTDARLAGPTARMREAMATDDTRSASRVIADRSGGITVVHPDPTGAAQRVLAASSASYIVRYIPARADVDERLRALDVRVRRAGVRVRARSAYARLSDPDFEALRDEKPLGVAVAAVVPSRDLQLEATAEPRRSGSRTTVRATVTVLGASGADLPARDVIEVLAIAVNTKGKTVAKAGGRFEMERRGAVMTTEPLLLQPLSPGRYQLRLAARSATLDRTGSVFLDLEIR